MIPQYMISSVMLEEHRQIVERAMPDRDWPAAVPVARRPIRPRLGRVLRAIADRLDPAGARVECVKLFVVPYPGEVHHET